MRPARLLSGAELLRRIVRVMEFAPESFHDRYTAEQLLRIYTAHQLCEYDRYPDQWSAEQVAAAADAGTVPRFDDDGRPL